MFVLSLALRTGHTCVGEYLCVEVWQCLCGQKLVTWEQHGPAMKTQGNPAINGVDFDK
jgi:hypothetical protein